MGIAIETRLLAAVCLLDAIATVWLIAAGLAVEANPLLAFFVTHGGLGAFLAAKLTVSFGPLAALERLRRQRPQFVNTVLRVGLAGYVAVYAAGVWRANWS